MKYGSVCRFLLVLVATSTCLAQQPPVLTLEAAISAAIAGNKQIQISALDVTKASEATAEARTARLPQLHSYILGGAALNPIDFTIPRGTLGVYPGIGPLPARDSTISTPRRLTALVYGSAAQPISQLFFKIRLGIRESQLGEQLAHENLRQQRQEAAHQVRQAYYELAETQTQIASAETTLQYLTELIALTERNLAEQTVLKSDTLSVKAKLSRQRFQLLSLRDAQDTQREALNRLLGRDIRTEFSVEPEPLPSVEELDLAAAQKKAIEQRPEIRKANLQTAKAELEVRRERAEYLPDFSLQLSYLSLANVNFLPQNATSAGFLFEWQPFDWGQKHHRIQALQASVKQATLTTQDAEQQILIDVNAKYRKLLETRALLDTQAAAQDAEREKLRVVMNRYKENAVLLTDVLQQQSSLAQADSQYQQSVAGFWKAKADFERALGEEY
jgi:outer membrane protein TolC